MLNTLDKIVLPEEINAILKGNDRITIPETRSELLSLAMGGNGNEVFEVSYEVPGKGRVVEATIVRCKNGVVVNYNDVYLRRRDPDCMVIADDGETDKQRYNARYGLEFDSLREKTLEWLAQEKLILMPFMAGGDDLGYPVLLIAPDNAGFFAGGLADLQGFIPASELKGVFKPKAIIYLAPPFRHTHFEGKQMVVHNRRDDIYELFSYNLYPGPSAKKGVYGVLLKIGEDEGWVTAHGSTVLVSHPSEKPMAIMHEGASGGGKSEMIEELHRELDGDIILGKNLVTSERIYLKLKETCKIRPVTDDMALCHPKLQNGNKKLVVRDAENGWFLRTDHIKKYGTDPYLERRCTHPEEPLIFLNYDAAPGSTCLLWEHIMDAPGKPCPNPRVIMPRRFIPDIVDMSVEIDVRSFGVRTPPCTKEKPTYGIIGLFHILPPGLAWLWRLVAPRGHDNPSITDTEGMTSEGVGSYWPFATGKMVDQANLLLEQIIKTADTRYILVPNQHIGVYRVGFMPQWVAREYLARQGSADFKPGQLVSSRSSLLGYALNDIEVDGTSIPKTLLEVNHQPEVGNEGFDAGSKILLEFFRRELAKFNTTDLHPVGREIIACCLDNGSVDEYLKLIPMKL